MESRSELLALAEERAVQLLSVVDVLEKSENVGRLRSGWQQSAGWVRRVRGVVRSELDLERHRAKETEDH